MDYRFYASDYDSDSESVVSENQPLYAFLFVAVLLKGEQRMLEKRETQQIPTPKKEVF